MTAPPVHNFPKRFKQENTVNFRHRMGTFHVRSTAAEIPSEKTRDGLR